MTTFFINVLKIWCQCVFHRLQNILVCFGSSLSTSQARKLRRAIACCSLALSTTGTVWSYTHCKKSRHSKKLHFYHEIKRKQHDRCTSTQKYCNLQVLRNCDWRPKKHEIKIKLNNLLTFSSFRMPSLFLPFPKHLLRTILSQYTGLDKVRHCILTVSL